MSVLELMDNVFQLIVTLSVGVTSCVLAVKNRDFLPFQYIAGASIFLFTGTLYWTIYFMIYQDFPYYFSASELCYMCNYLFLIYLALFIYKKHTRESSGIAFTTIQKIILLLLPFYVGICNVVSYLMYGGLLWNLYYAVPMIILACFISRNLFIIRSKPLHMLHVSMICLLIFNASMYLVSCFGLNNLYLLFDFLLTLTFPAMLFFITKESKL